MRQRFDAILMLSKGAKELLAWTRPTQADVDGYFDKLNDWGRRPRTADQGLAQWYDDHPGGR